MKARKLTNRIFSSVLVGCMLVTMFASAGNYSYADPALGASEGTQYSYAIKNTDEDVGTAANPFTILEIVPDISMGVFGYYIPGCEPVDIEAIRYAKNKYGSFVNEFVQSGDPDSDDPTTASVFTNNGDKSRYGYAGDVGVLSSGLANVFKVSKSGTIADYLAEGYFERVEDGRGNYKWNGSEFEFVQDSSCYTLQGDGTYAVSESSGAVVAGADFVWHNLGYYTTGNYKDSSPSWGGLSSENDGNKGADGYTPALAAEGYVYISNALDNVDALGELETDSAIDVEDDDENLGNTDNDGEEIGYNPIDEDETVAGDDTAAGDDTTGEVSEDETATDSESEGGESASESAGDSNSTESATLLGKNSNIILEANDITRVGASVGDRFRYYGEYANTPIVGWDSMYQKKGDDPSKAKVDDRFYTIRNEDFVYYGYSDYENNDILVQQLYGEKSEDGFVSQVIVVTPAMLMGDDKDQYLELIDSADLIAFHDYAEENAAIAAMYDQAHPGHVTDTKYQSAECLSTLDCDLSWEAVARIMKRMAGAAVDAYGNRTDAAALVLDKRMIGSNGSASNDYTKRNNGKLYYINMVYGAYQFYNLIYSDTENFKEYVPSSEAGGGSTASYKGETVWGLWGLDGTYSATVNDQAYGGSNLVKGSVYCFTGENLFSQKYNIPSISYNQWGIGANEAFDSGLIDDRIVDNGYGGKSITTNSMIEYILNAAARYKQELNILEIEPTAGNGENAPDCFISEIPVKKTDDNGVEKWQYTDAYREWLSYLLPIIPWFTGKTGTAANDIHVTQMASYEFNGDVSDLIGQYDLILIGAAQDKTNGLNGYTDTSLGNLAWTTYGDLVNNSSNSLARTDAYSSRATKTDINKKKYEQIVDLLHTGAVIMDDTDWSLFTKSSSNSWNSAYVVDNNKVDSSSYVAALAKQMVGKDGDYDSNVFEYSTIAGTSKIQTTLTRAIAVAQVDIQFYATSESSTGYPVEYEIKLSNSGKKLDGEDNLAHGTYTATVGEGNKLRYNFTLAGMPGQEYGVNVLLDTNGDSMFTGSITDDILSDQFGIETNLSDEKQKSLTITDKTDNKKVSNGKLVDGHDYQVEVSLSKELVGLLPWKIEVYNNGTDTAGKKMKYIRDTASGMTRIKASKTADKKIINVLQMCLTKNMSNGTPTVRFDKVFNEGGTYNDLLEDVNANSDYILNIEYMENSDWMSAYNGNLVAWEEKLNQYDMLIVGYKDVQQFTDNETFWKAYENFYEAGKAIILSHDTIKGGEFQQLEPTTLTEWDSAVRTISGQRNRYYSPELGKDYTYSFVYSQGAKKDMLPSKTRSSVSGYVNTYNKNYTRSNGIEGVGSTYSDDDSASKGFDNASILWRFYGSSGNETDRNHTKNNADGRWYETYNITMANSGRVTTYPYDLETKDYLTVKKTHMQNYKLDLEVREDGDANVWYNLSDSHSSIVDENECNSGFYSSREGDSANNYYIYSAGNVTYTGFGHTGDLTKDEAKLFINTMIAAYRVTPEVPYLTCENPDFTTIDKVSTGYVEINGVASEKGDKKIYMKINDESNTNSTEYYVNFIDDEGNVLSAGSDGYENLVDGSFTKTENGYQIKDTEQTIDGIDCSFTFNTTYDKIINGKAIYALQLTSIIKEGTKDKSYNSTSKVQVFPMPFFNLD